MPLVIGTTRDELSLFPDPRAESLDDAQLQRWVTRLSPDLDPTSTLRAYREQLGAGASSSAVWDALRTDAFMRIPNLRVADAHAARGAPSFVYRFDWEAPGIGAAHAVDVPFTFGTFDREGWAAAVGYDDRAELVSASIRRAWTTFARTCAPDPGTPWEQYDVAKDRATLVFGTGGPSLARDPHGGTRRCWPE